MTIGDGLRDQRLARLVEFSLRDDSLDWETLAQIDRLAWGIKDGCPPWDARVDTASLVRGTGQ